MSDTTTKITTIQLPDFRVYAGQDADAFNLEAVTHDYLARLNADLLDGITVHSDGDVFAETSVAGAARQIDYRAVMDGIDLGAIFYRNERKS